jgi:hypothetical protein
MIVRWSCHSRLGNYRIPMVHHIVKSCVWKKTVIKCQQSLRIHSIIPYLEVADVVVSWLVVTKLAAVAVVRIP